MKRKRLSMKNVFVCIEFFSKFKSISFNYQLLVAAFATGAIMGVEGHVWYSFLDRHIVQSTWRNVFKKVLLDETIAAPFYTLTYIVGKEILKIFIKNIFFFQGTSVLEGRTSYRELMSDTRRNFLPLYLADCLIYAPIQIINFKYIPSFYRVPFLSLSALIFDAFISAYKHEHPGIHVHNDQK